MQTITSLIQSYTTIVFDKQFKAWLRLDNNNCNINIIPQKESPMTSSDAETDSKPIIIIIIIIIIIRNSAND